MCIPRELLNRSPSDPICSEQPMENAEPSGRRILILDDERPLLNIISLMLEARGWRCTAAGNARECQEAISGVGIDAALLDVNAGNSDGVALAEQIRRSEPSLPIVIMTGCPDEDLNNRVRKIGRASVIAKPFKIQELEQALEAARLG